MPSVVTPMLCATTRMVVTDVCANLAMQVYVARLSPAIALVRYCILCHAGSYSLVQELNIVCHLNTCNKGMLIIANLKRDTKTCRWYTMKTNEQSSESKSENVSNS